MARYHILEDFKGSQDGRFTDDFKAGTVAELSDYLAAAIDPRWARIVEEKPATVAIPAAIEHPPAKPPGVEPSGPHLFSRRNKGAK